MNSIKRWSLGAFCLGLTAQVAAEPWIDTRDAWLRADIELLASKGIIKSPINTYPLMWSNIISDLEKTKLSTVPDELRSVYLRLRRNARSATEDTWTPTVRLSVASHPQVIRTFGASMREEGEISVKNTGHSNFLAWNIESTYVNEPSDGDNHLRFDHSYLAFIWSNWVFSAGAQDKWWGPGWESALLVSNNARPAPGVMLQRNNSDAFETPWLNWIGPWTFSAFASLLEDEHFVSDFDGGRTINDVKLLGLSINFRPLESLEIGLRRTAQWGGEGRPEGLSALWDLAIADDNCFSFQVECRINEPGNQVAGLDFSWHLPFSHPVTFYGHIIGEDEIDGLLPSQRIFTTGLSTSLVIWDQAWRSYLEFSDTAIWQDTYNIAYEHHIYQNGYRYYGRGIGSTFDNDTEALSIGFIGSFNDTISARFFVQTLKINRDGKSRSPNAPHSIAVDGSDASKVGAEFRLLTKIGTFNLELEYSDKVYDQAGRIDDDFRVGLEWEYGF